MSVRAGFPSDISAAQCKMSKRDRNALHDHMNAMIYDALIGTSGCRRAAPVLTVGDELIALCPET